MWKMLHSERSRQAIIYQCRTLIFYFFYLFSKNWRNYFHNIQWRSACQRENVTRVTSATSAFAHATGVYLGFGAIRTRLAKLAQPPTTMKASVFIYPCKFFVRVFPHFAMLYVWNYLSSNLFGKRSIQSWGGRTLGMVLFLRTQIFERTKRIKSDVNL